MIELGSMKILDYARHDEHALKIPVVKKKQIRVNRSMNIRDLLKCTTYPCQYCS